MAASTDRNLIRKLRSAVAEVEHVANMRRPSQARVQAADERLAELSADLGERLVAGTFDAWDALGLAEVKARRTRGGGSCYYETAKQRWVTELRVDGKRVRRSHKTEAEARGWLDEASERLATGRGPEQSSVTLTEWVEQRLAVWETLGSSRKRRPLRPATMRNHRHAFDTWWKPRLGDVRLVALQRSQVEEVMTEMAKAGLSANTVRINSAVISKALNDAVLEGIVPSNVAQSLSPSPERTESDHLTPKEAKKLIAAAPDHRYGVGVALAVLTGMRRGELLGLSWSRVKLNADVPYVVVDHQVTTDKVSGEVVFEATTKTGMSGKRTIPLPPSAVELLRKERAAQAEAKLAAGEAWSNPHNVVFTDGLGGALYPDTFTKACYSITKKVLGRRVSPHALRHTAASLFADAGVSPKVVQAILGHATESMTSQVYTHTYDEQLVAGVAALDARLAAGS